MNILPTKEDQRMKKIVALILTCVLLLGLVSAHAEEPGKYDRLNVGVTTPFSGNFLDDALGSNLCDQDVRNLIHGYNLVKWDADKGAFEFNQPVVTATTASEDRSTFYFAIADNLTYNDGTKITARDYAFTLLLLGSPQMKEATGKQGDIGRILGAADYQDGTLKTLAGFSVIDDYLFSVTLDPNYVPYFYELKILDISPLPISVIAPGCTVKSNDNGAYIDGPFTAELLQKTLLDPETGYVSHPAVTCGPYKLSAYDGDSVTLDLNEAYIGDENGAKPTIPQIVIKVTDPRFIIGDLNAGELDLAVRCVREDHVTSGISLIGQGDFAMKSYMRAGLSFISFCADKGPTADQNVRQAAAMCMDKQALTDAYLGRYGVTVNGYYGIGQWMFRMANGAILQAEDDESDWSDLQIDRLAGYELNPEKAAALLDAAGWNLNENGEKYTQRGVRCKKIGDDLVPLRLKMIYPEENGAGALFQETFIDHLAEAGIALETEAMPMTELLKVFYKQTAKDCDMIMLGTNFADVFDPAGEYDENGTSIRNGITDELLKELAIYMRGTEPGEAAEYCRRWLSYQERRSELAAEIPLYSDAYMDFHITALQNYAPAPTGSWTTAIQQAFLSDYVPEAETGATEGGQGESEGSTEDFEEME